MSLSLAIETEHAQPPSLAHTHFSPDPSALTEILNPATTLAVWQREHAGLEQLELIRQEAQSALLDADWRDIRIACDPSDMPSVLNELWGTRYAHLQFDSASGLIRPDAVVQQLQPMDVGILKGDAWPGNEGRGIVHRSPSCDSTQPRIVMTLDFAA